MKILVNRIFNEAAFIRCHALNKGHGRAAAVLGLMALRGQGLPQDAEQARKFFARADELGFDVDGYLREVGFARP